MRFSLRHLFAIILASAFISLLFGVIVTFRKGNAGPITDTEQWPTPYTQIVADLGISNDQIDVYGLNRMLDRRSIARIQHSRQFVDALVHTGGLVKTDNAHPKAARLLQSAPRDWVPPMENSCVWFATPGFGTMHIEVQDLFLVCYDPLTETAIVLHNNIF